MPAMDIAEFKFQVERLQPKENDIILLRYPEGVEPGDVGDYLTAIGMAMEDRPSLLVVALPHGWDLKALDEREMGDYGWVRADRR